MKIIDVNKCNMFSWKPIVAGAFVVIGLTFLLNLFGTAIGLTAFTTNKEGIETFALGGLLGIAIGIVSSMFAAGWITGYLQRNYSTERHMGALYGFLTWSVSLIITIFLASEAQQYVSFYSHFISGTIDAIQISKTNNAAPITVISTLKADKLVISTYVIFILFFLSALACSLGGHLGMFSQRKYDMNK